ncbi:UNVERIFIED_ORG: hypothetical protein ABIB63_003849 [Xanthomonas axonopodis]
MEVAPGDACTGTCSSRLALPAATRKFGRLVDCSAFQAGDLILTGPAGEDPDFTSRKIIQAQSKAYSALDARWTHAAVWIGDGENICEANFGVPGRRRGVMIRSLNEYADGEHLIKIRRPSGLTDRERTLVATGAIVNLKQSYDFSFLIRLWWKAVRGQGFHDRTGGRIPITANALVCSTLYADALAYGAHIAVAGNGICVPAQLSCSPLFEDTVPISWLELI